jgi:hypothetical protein
MVVYTTTDWSGWGKIASPIIREKFDDEITKYLGLYSSRLACFFSKQTEIDFCDLMYVLVCDKSYFTNMQRRIWILCVGYYLITKYGHLDFSRNISIIIYKKLQIFEMKYAFIFKVL